MLKASEGKAGAAETLRYFGSKLKPPTVSYQTALALLEEGDARLTELEALAGTHPDFGPLPWLISQEYSEARRGDQTLADQRSEKQWLEKFRAAQAAGKFQRYFLDKKDAQQWLDTADERWAKLASVPQKVLENPVTLSTLYGNSGWDVTFTLTDFKVTELFYRLDGKGDFRSTGHLPFTNPQTGLPKVNLHVPMPDLSSGRHTVEVKYVDRNGKTNGPYSLSFSTDEELLKQGKWALDSTPGSWLQFKDFDGKVLLYFSHLLSYTAVLKEIRYSLDSDKLDQSFKFKPGTKYGEHDRDEAIFLAVPPDIRYASVQVIYKDGTVSPLRRIVRPK